MFDLKSSNTPMSLISSLLRFEYIHNYSAAGLEPNSRNAWVPFQFNCKSETEASNISIYS